MSINELNQIAELAELVKRRYKIKRDSTLDAIIEYARSGAIELEDALDRIKDYEDNFGGKISKEYVERKRGNNR